MNSNLGRQFQLFDASEYDVPVQEAPEPTPEWKQNAGSGGDWVEHNLHDYRYEDENDDWREKFGTPDDQIAMVGKDREYTPSLDLPTILGNSNRGYRLRTHPDAAWDSAAWRQTSVRDADFSTGKDVHIGQEYVGTEGVNHYYDTFEESGVPYIDNDDKFATESRDYDESGLGIDQFPRAVKADNVTRTINGHHRIAAAAIHGYGSMPMRILDMDKRAEQGFQGSFWPLDRRPRTPLSEVPEGVRPFAKRNRAREDERAFGRPYNESVQRFERHLDDDITIDNRWDYFR